MRLILQFDLLDWDLIPIIGNGYYKFADDRKSYGKMFSFLCFTIWFIRA